MSEDNENSKKWKTAITTHKEGIPYVRGYNLIDMIGKLTFSESIFLILKGELPTENERKMMDAILVSCIDHGIAPPSITAARTVYSGGNPINVGVAAGVMTLGDAHGGAIEQCAKILQKCISNNTTAKDIVAKYRDEKKRFPGYGHKIYTEDPRTTKLLEIAKELDYDGKHIKFALELKTEIDSALGKSLCLNVDGAIAAIMSDMDFDWKLGKGLFIISRTAGIVAHIHEESTREKPFRRLNEGEYEYNGVEERELPEYTKP